MTKNKKGFTLIELLAVIVVLAIIALIVTPLVLNVIDTAKKGTFQASVYNIIEAAEKEYLIKKINGEIPTFTEIDYNNRIEERVRGDLELKFKGQKPQNGKLIINDIGEVAVALHQDGWCALKGYSEDEIKLEKLKKEECKIQEEIPEAMPSKPELSEGMIPITWNNTNWVKADINDSWYDYRNFEWANAVLVTASSRTNYQNADPGTVVSESDILAYFVWIPRYRYKLFNVNSELIPVQEIEIVFENKTIEKSNGSANEEWLTHPAFTFGDKEINGIWVGKFETSTITSDICYTTPSYNNCNKIISQPRIKPNVKSLGSQYINQKFETAKVFSSNTAFGLTGTDDSHMMKNMEWGAVAYLSQSKYGKYGNPIYDNSTGLEKEIYNNNIDSTGGGPAITGCAASTLNASSLQSATCPLNNQYNTIQGVKASTTGTIYGIYDMSSGNDEVVMGAMYNTNNSTIAITSSGFTQATIDSSSMAKYLDKYKYGTSSADYSRRHLGDATGETRGWNNDGASMIYAPATYNSAFFYRGSYYLHTSYAGIFNFSSSTGRSGSDSFRTVIVTN